MFCNKCGKEINNTEKFCPFCGAPTGMKDAGNVNMNNATQPKQSSYIQEKSKKTGNKKPIIIVIIVVVILFAIIGIFSGSDSESSSGQTSSGTLRSNPEYLNFHLTVVNNTGVDIYGLYASEVNVDNWEEDILGVDILENGSATVINFQITSDDLDWDFAISDAYGNTLEFYDLSFADCSVDGATLTLDDNGYATLR